VLALYASAIFLAAALVFWVQPMLARELLPILGGSPAVWTASMVFFQAGLLGGYLAAHGLGLLGRSRPRLALAAHAGLALGAIALLPVGVRSADVTGPPALWVLWALLLAAAGPYVVLATVSPLVQRVFAAADHRLSHDPYPLYAASNAGSIVGLLAYPLVIEPRLDLASQGRVWSWLFVGVAVLLVAGAAASWPRVRRAGEVDAGSENVAPSWRCRLAWVGLALVPSSLMLGVTQHITTDLAAVPLLWVIPLALYLGTFIAAFGVRGAWLGRATRRAAPVAAVGLAIAMLLDAREPLWLVVLAHLAAFTVAALLCHVRLVALRPPPLRLTEFYLLVALGGVLGGVANALVAPAVLDSLLEYPLAFAAAMLALPAAGARRGAGKAARKGDGANPGRGTRGGGRDGAGAPREGVLASLALGAAITGGFGVALLAFAAAGLAPLSGSATLAERAALVGPAALVLYLVHARGRAFALALAGVLVVGHMAGGSGRTIHAERTFFGVHTVDRLRVDREGAPPLIFHQLRHGSTTHGLQAFVPGGGLEPLAYYHRRSPIAEVFALIDGQAAPRAHHRLDRVALVGLGTGALAAYGRSGMAITAYEIDPAVVRIARDPSLFTYLADSPADRVEVVLGDGRLSLASHEGAPYDLIVLDAFTSDAIPVHLLTVEAFGVYLSRLAEDGVLAVHISNRYLDLEPVVAAAADRLGLAATMRADARDAAESAQTGRFESVWVMLARSPEALGPLIERARWRPPRSPAGFTAWTDDSSDLLSVLGRSAPGG